MKINDSGVGKVSLAFRTIRHFTVLDSEDNIRRKVWWERRDSNPRGLLRDRRSNQLNYAPAS
jgi:hypothetical protein